MTGKVVINITISYRFNENDNWVCITIKPEEYFDKNYCDRNEIITIDSIPRFNHAVEYIDIEKLEEIKYTKLLINDEQSGEEILIKESFWNGQRNNIIERIDSGGNNEYY